MSDWKPYFIAIALGLIVGIERENTTQHRNAMGVRTFILISLLGAIAGGIESKDLMIGMFAGFTLTLIAMSYFLQVFQKNKVLHLGLTSEFAAAIVFAGGVASHKSPVFVAALAPVLALILFSKQKIHQFTKALKPEEIRAAISILLISSVVIDLLPDHTLDPWGIFNPRKFGYLVLALAIIEFSSYIIVKAMGEKKGSLVVGFLGGLVSSTAILITCARKSSNAPTTWRASLSMVLAAQIASLTELFIVLSQVSQKLTRALLPSLLGTLAYLSLILFLLRRNQTETHTELELKSPLDWSAVTRVSIVFSILLAMVSIAENWLGENAIFSLTFLAGIFELQGISIANATLFNQNHISIEIAVKCALLAVIASISTKVALSWFYARNKFAGAITVILLPLLAFLTWMSR